jgi:hypothetical protein
MTKGKIPFYLVDELRRCARPSLITAVQAVAMCSNRAAVECFCSDAEGSERWGPPAWLVDALEPGPVRTHDL